MHDPRRLAPAFATSLMAFAVLMLAGCGQSTVPSAVATPAPSATLERAPTRAPGGFVTAAGSGPAPATMIGTPVPPPHLAGTFVFSPGDGSIWIQDAAAGGPRPLVKATSELFAEAPAFSPDGKRVVFVESKLSATGAAQSSVHLIDSDGNGDRALALPPDNKTTLGSPVFSPDGGSVYYTASFPVPPGNEHFEILRIPSGGGSAQPVLQDAHSAVLSADGAKLLFTKFNTASFTASLWIANADGSDAKQIVPDDLFSIVDAARFSPDGQWVLFAASGPPTRPLPHALAPVEPCQPELLCDFAATAHADGLPWDLWLVSVDGNRFEQLTNVGFDSPWPAWSRDGKYIAIWETSGFYVLDMDRRLLSMWNPQGGHGVLDWWTPNS